MICSKKGLAFNALPGWLCQIEFRGSWSKQFLVEEAVAKSQDPNIRNKILESLDSIFRIEDWSCVLQNCLEMEWTWMMLLLGMRLNPTSVKYKRSHQHIRWVVPKIKGHERNLSFSQKKKKTTEKENISDVTKSVEPEPQHYVLNVFLATLRIL